MSQNKIITAKGNYTTMKQIKPIKINLSNKTHEESLSTLEQLYRTTSLYEPIDNHHQAIKWKTIAATTPEQLKAMIKTHNKLPSTIEVKFTHIITFRDSFRLIPIALEKFHKTFNIQASKAVMPHGLYSSAVKNPNQTIKQALKHLPKHEHQQFLDNIDAQQKVDTTDLSNTFNAIEYAISYCVMDCKTLQQGYEKFRETFMSNCGFDIDEMASISSAAQQYLIQKNHYEGCYELTATPRLFIEEAIVGGQNTLPIYQTNHH